MCIMCYLFQIRFMWRRNRWILYYKTIKWGKTRIISLPPSTSPCLFLYKNISTFLSIKYIPTYSLRKNMSLHSILCEQKGKKSWGGNIYIWQNKLYFLKDFIYLFLERGEERKKERERNNKCGCLSRAPHQGPGPQSKHIP